MELSDVCLSELVRISDIDLINSNAIEAFPMESYTESPYSAEKV